MRVDGDGGNQRFVCSPNLATFSPQVGYVSNFIATSPEICWHIFLMAVCSAIGQLFIFYTIKAFGPLVFATIQTVRQFLSVILSIAIFAHPINAGECAGIFVVFITLSSQIALKANARRKQDRASGPERKR